MGNFASHVHITWGSGDIKRKAGSDMIAVMLLNKRTS